jgi:hypothetical protein
MMPMSGLFASARCPGNAERRRWEAGGAGAPHPAAVAGRRAPYLLRARGLAEITSMLHQTEHSLMRCAVLRGKKPHGGRVELAERFETEHLVVSCAGRAGCEYE